MDKIKRVPLPLAQPPVQDRASIRIQRADRVVDAPRTLALWHLASFDAPSVAVAWSLGFAWVARVQLAWQIPLVLALTTWWIYLSDRLLDARAGLRLHAHEPLRERHYFHWRHRRLFAPLAAASACICVIIALVFLPPIVRERGSMLAVASFAYFSGVHANHPAHGTSAFVRATPLVNKELLVGLLFAAGCILPAWSAFAGSATTVPSMWLLWIPCAYFAALVWLNCWCIARWEFSNAQSAAPQGEAPVARAFFATATTAFLLALAGLLLAVLVPAPEIRSSQLLSAGAVSAILLALLDLVRPRITPLALRVGADLVMLTPLILLLR